MTPQELKYSILQRALQGKLVNQNHNDGLVDLSGIKNKETEEFEFDLPDAWAIAHLEAITNAIPSKRYQILESQVLQEGEFPVISQSKEYSIGFCNEEEKVYHHAMPVVAFGDHTTEVKYIEFDFVVGADGVKLFEPLYDVVSAEFLYYVLQFYSKDLNKVGGYSRHYKYIKNKPIPLPPLAEQKRIVAKIEELLPYIDRYGEAYTKLDEFNKRFPVDMQKSILQTAIQGKLVEQRPEEGTGEELYQLIQVEKQQLIKDKKISKSKPLDEIPLDDMPFDLPTSWKWIRLGEILTSTDAGKSPQCENRSRVGSEWGVIKTTAVQDGFFLSEENKVLPAKFEVQDNQIIHAGDFLITRAGPKNRTGIMCVVEEEPENLILSDKTVRLSYISGLVDPYYLRAALSSPAMQYWVVESMTGMAASQVNISQEKMRTFILPLPPLAEQKRIVAKLEEILPLCDRLK